MLIKLYHDAVEIKSAFLNGIKVFGTSEVPVEPENQIANITITGIAKVGEILTATVTDANGLPSIINYQWYADGEVISDATDETYVLKEAEAGKGITVKAEFTDNDGYAESVISSVSELVVSDTPANVTPLRFKTTNLKSSMEYPLKIKISADGEDSWELVESGDKVADSSGFLASGVTSAISTESWELGTTILTLATSGANKNYELFAKNRKCSLNHSKVSGGVDGTVIVENFTIDTPLLQLRLANTHLTVPSTLPSYMTDLTSLFNTSDLFNQDISGWDVSSVNNMRGMFYNTSSFNQDISSWNVSSVTDMGIMFFGSTSFNSDLSNWDVSSVTDMLSMFYNTTAFNSDLSTWDVSNVTNMSGMFRQATSFNKDLSSWNVSSVTDMTLMFMDTKAFNQDLSKWCVSLIPSNPSNFDSNAVSWRLPKPVWGTCPRGEDSVTVEIGLKADYSGSGWYKTTDTGTVFNKGVPEGETKVFSDSPKEYVSVYTKEDAKLYGERAAVSNITNMESLFEEDTEFNQDISSWDVSNVTIMRYMFLHTTSLNQDISSWDVSKVTNMRGMFYGAISFNSDISSWDVSNVTDMNYMFGEATSFNQDLSEWCVVLPLTKHIDFDSSTTAWTLPKPVWGTCPRGENLV